MVVRVLVLSCAVGCPLSGHYTEPQHHVVVLLFLSVFSITVLCVLSADQF